MNGNQLILYATILLIAAVVHVLAQDRPGRSFLIALGRPASAPEKARSARLRWINLASTALALLLVTVQQTPSAILIGTTVLPLLPIGVLVYETAQTTKSIPVGGAKFAVPLTGPPSILKLCSPALQLGNLAMIAAASATVWALAAQMPEHLPMHWNAAGQIDGYGRPLDLLFLSYLSLGLTVMMWVVLWSLGRTRWVAAVDASKRHVELMVEQRRLMVRLIEVLMISIHVSMLVTMLLMAFFALPGRGGYGVVIALPSILISGVGVLGSIIYFLPKLSALADKLQQLGQPQTLGTRADGWILGGLVYFAPRDAGVFVPKRSGLGMTLNLARPGAWLFLLGLLVLPTALTALWAFRY